MITKTETAKNLFSSGKIKEALKIFKSFKIGFSTKKNAKFQYKYRFIIAFFKGEASCFVCIVNYILTKYQNPKSQKISGFIL